MSEHTWSHETRTEATETALLGVAEAAERLGLTRDNTRALCEQRFIGAIKIGREWRIPPESLTQFRQAVARGELAQLRGAIVLLSEGKPIVLQKKGAA